MEPFNKNIPVRPAGGDFLARKRALVFSTNQLITRQIKQQLEKKNFLVWVVSEERQILPQIDQADPEIILMDVVVSTIRPLPDIVAEVFVWIRGRARAINKFLDTPSQYLWAHSKIILFKSDSEITATGSLTAEMADTDELVYQCSLFGTVKYIGLYSSFSFISKIRSLMENFDER